MRGYKIRSLCGKLFLISLEMKFKVNLIDLSQLNQFADKGNNFKFSIEKQKKNELACLLKVNLGTMQCS